MTKTMLELQKANPTSSDKDAHQVDGAAERMLNDILRSPQDAELETQEANGRRRWSGKRVLAVAATAAVIGSVLVVQPWSASGNGVGGTQQAAAAEPAMLAYSSMNPLPAGPEAAKIAARVRTLTESVPDPYYMKTTAWSKSPEKKWDVHSNWTVNGPITTESWLTKDGQWTISTGGEAPSGPPSPYFGSDGAGYPRVDTAAQLHRVLPDYVGAPTPQASAAQKAFSITGLVSNQYFNPIVRAAAIEDFAKSPGVVSNGYVTDRLGRNGVAFTATGKWDKTSYPQRETLIFDPNTGQLLSSEEWVLALEADAKPFKTPMVTGYTLFQSSPKPPPVPQYVPPVVSGFQRPAVTATCSATDADTVGDIKDYLAAMSWSMRSVPPVPDPPNSSNAAENARYDAASRKWEQEEAAHPKPSVANEQDPTVWFDGARKLQAELPSSTPSAVRKALAQYLAQIEPAIPDVEGIARHPVGYNPRAANVVLNYLSAKCG